MIDLLTFVMILILVPVAMIIWIIVVAIIKSYIDDIKDTKRENKWKN